MDNWGQPSVGIEGFLGATRKRGDKEEVVGGGRESDTALSVCTRGTLPH